MIDYLSYCSLFAVQLLYKLNLLLFQLSSTITSRLFIKVDMAETLAVHPLVTGEKREAR